MNELVKELIALGVLQTPRIINAFKAIDRKDFVLPEYMSEAYQNYPLPIGYGQTISQPYTVAFMLELLQPKPGQHSLDIGSGSGWTTALLAHIVGSKGKVYGVEIIPELVTLGSENVEKYNLPQASITQAGKELGLRGRAPFDNILVSAAGEHLPKELLAQLKTGGTLVIPVQDNVLKIKKISEKNSDIQAYKGFAFVPLIE